MAAAAANCFYEGVVRTSNWIFATEWHFFKLSRGGFDVDFIGWITYVGTSMCFS